MITLDVRHYCATLLHPKYRLLKICTENERVQCHKYIREQLNLIRSTTTTTTTSVDALSQPPTKKFKRNEDFFSRFEDDYPSNIRSPEDDQSSNDSDEYDYDIKQSDELDRYLIMDIDKTVLLNDPLTFWKAQSQQFPLLSKLAKQIHSIPATSTSVERQFSAAGLVINERRTNLSPHQLDNILLIRSVQKLN
jgi:hypothetical protein